MPRGMQELISPTRDQTHIPCIRRWIATHSSNLAWKNPTDRGAWEAAVHGVTKNWTQLSDLTSLSQPLDTWEVLRLFKKCLQVFKAEHLECSTFFFFFLDLRSTSWYLEVVFSPTALSRTIFLLTISELNNVLLFSKLVSLQIVTFNLH